MRRYRDAWDSNESMSNSENSFFVFEEKKNKRNLLCTDTWIFIQYSTLCDYTIQYAQHIHFWLESIDNSRQNTKYVTSSDMADTHLVVLFEYENELYIVNKHNQRVFFLENDKVKAARVSYQRNLWCLKTTVIFTESK